MTSMWQYSCKEWLGRGQENPAIMELVGATWSWESEDSDLEVALPEEV